MRKLIVLTTLLALAGCATDNEQCESHGFLRAIPDSGGDLALFVPNSAAVR
jgi:hypothetical protein